MLKLLRNILRSPWGKGLAFALFAVVALAFGFGDIASNGGFGGFGGMGSGNRAATIGNQSVSITDLGKEVSQSFDAARQQNPKLTSKEFVAGGGFDAVAKAVFDRVAITVFGARYGIVANKRLIDSELAKIPSLQGRDGKFNDKLYQDLLAQRQMSDADVRAQISAALVARQVLLPAQFGATVPAEATSRYAALLKEHRTGAVAILPSQAFAPRSKPGDAEIAAFYAAHRDAFTLPERRVIRYAIFAANTVKTTVTPPTDAEIGAYYTAHAADYAASESRKVTLLILPDEAGARAVAQAGGSLEAAAKARGLAANVLGPLTRDALAAQSSPEVAAAVFTARAGTMIAPVKNPLGWYVAHVDAVIPRPARSLAQVHGEIATLLAARKQQAALSDITTRITENFDHGGAITDAAKQLSVTLDQTDPIIANGQVYGKPGMTAPRELAQIIPAAFAMDREGQPQFAELQGGRNFVIFDVKQIVPAAPAPLGEIKNDVAAAWAMQKGAEGARAAAFKLLGEVRKGQEVGKAMASLGVPLPPVQPLSFSRDQLAAANGRVPQYIALFFDMAPGTAKLMTLPGDRGWILIQLKEDRPGTLAKDDPLLASTAKSLGELAGNEYAEELRAAIRQTVGVKRNEAAITRVKSQMAGGS